MAKKREKLFSKVFMIIFLVMIVLGFTIPGFFNSGTTPNQGTEPRICQSDADCYLMCDTPVASLCSQNLCQQNNCDEYSAYPLETEPINLQLRVELNNKKVQLDNRTNPNDFYVKFEGNQVQLFTEGLSLAQIMGKVNFPFNGLETNLTINGETSAYYGNYRPQAGDNITISVS